jgi:hypothetical protein
MILLLGLKSFCNGMPIAVYYFDGVSLFELFYCTYAVGVCFLYRFCCRVTTDSTWCSDFLWFKFPFKTEWVCIVSCGSLSFKMCSANQHQPKQGTQWHQVDHWIVHADCLGFWHASLFLAQCTFLYHSILCSKINHVVINHDLHLGFPRVISGNLWLLLFTPTVAAQNSKEMVPMP